MSKELNFQLFPGYSSWTWVSSVRQASKQNANHATPKIPKTPNRKWYANKKQLKIRAWTSTTPTLTIETQWKACPSETLTTPTAIASPTVNACVTLNAINNFIPKTNTNTHVLSTITMRLVWAHPLTAEWTKVPHNTDSPAVILRRAGKDTQSRAIAVAAKDRAYSEMNQISTITTIKETIGGKGKDRGKDRKDTKATCAEDQKNRETIEYIRCKCHNQCVTTLTWQKNGNWIHRLRQISGNIWDDSIFMLFIVTGYNYYNNAKIPRHLGHGCSNDGSFAHKFHLGSWRITQLPRSCRQPE